MHELKHVINVSKDESTTLVNNREIVHKPHKKGESCTIIEAAIWFIGWRHIMYTVILKLFHLSIMLYFPHPPYPLIIIYIIDWHFTIRAEPGGGTTGRVYHPYVDFIFSSHFQSKFRHLNQFLSTSVVCQLRARRTLMFLKGSELHALLALNMNRLQRTSVWSDVLLRNVNHLICVRNWIEI